MNKLARGVVAGVALTAVTLTGCTRPPAAAAVVEGVRVPDELVRQTATVLTGVVGTNPALATTQATYDLTLHEAALVIADENNLRVTDGEVQQVLDGSQMLAAAASVEGGSAWARSIAYTNVVLEDVGREAFIEELQQLDIEINPRYGVWDAENYTIASSSLAVDAAS
ncbi:MAG: hypothetical protein ACK5LS_12630 [Propioniciclava sp.]